ncbi:hypothetical protein PIROE2DRAFT_3984 [Piromyces sp. E2]|nr:hypothetical protein PIROE2DRAFT_3984 [Piromyces sp. E2]|eukprot:OUM68383.1 hypothetical protein PIROE2DRAFT_3984 [Piromyces sp. E2]
MFNNNKLLKSSDESSEEDSSDHENDESLDMFQHDIKKMFKPRPPVKKMKMNKQEKKMIKKIKMDKLNDIIHTSENSQSYNTPSSSNLVVTRKNSFNSLSNSSIKNSYMNPDSREYITSRDYSDIQTTSSQNSINDNSNTNANTIDNNNNNNNNNKDLSIPIQDHNNKGKMVNNDIKTTAVIPTNEIKYNTKPKAISSFPNKNRMYKASSPLVINNTLESSTSSTSFLNNEREHPHYKKSNNHHSTKPQRRTFRSIFLRNPFSSNFSSSNLSSSNVSTSHFSSPSISSWTASTTTDSSTNKIGHHHNEPSSSNILKTSTSTMDINSYAPDLDLSTQIIIKNDSEMNDTHPLSSNDNIKTSEFLWNKENGVGKNQLLRDPANKDIYSSGCNLERSDSNVSEESHKSRNKVAKMLIKGWIHVIDGISLFNPYHNNYHLDSYSYNHRGSNKDNDENASIDQTSTSNNKAMIPFDPDQHRLSTTHFFNSYH